MLKSGDRDEGAWRSLAWRSPAGRSSLKVTCQEVTWRHHLHTLRSLKIKSNQRSYKTFTPKASGAMKEGVRPQESTSIPMSVCLSVCLPGREDPGRRPRAGAEEIPTWAWPACITHPPVGWPVPLALSPAQAWEGPASERGLCRSTWRESQFSPEKTTEVTLHSP